MEHYVKCEVCQTEKGLIIRTAENKRALTPGQYAVLYKDGECLGSAKIMWAPTNFTMDYLKNMVNKKLKNEIEKYKTEDCNAESEHVQEGKIERR